MTPLAPMPFPETSFALTLVLLLIAPLAIAGIALVNAGLGRSRSASAVDAGNAGGDFDRGDCVCAGWMGDCERERGTIMWSHAAGKSWNLAGAGRLFGAGLGSAPPRTQLTLLFELLSVALVALIPWGSGADRLRLPAERRLLRLLGALSVSAGRALDVERVAGAAGANFSMGSGFVDGGGAGRFTRWAEWRRWR